MDAQRSSRPRVCVFAPAPTLTVAIERAVDDRGDADVHLHAGGQGVWVARMLAELDVDTVLCATLGGETGTVLDALLAGTRATSVTVRTWAANGAYVHDRRRGARKEVATMAAGVLGRHEVDDLYNATLIEALTADVTVLTGPQEPATLPADVYRRLAHDAGEAGRTIVADLSGELLEAALAGGLSVVKVSEDELRRDGRLERAGSLQAAIAELRKAGAEDVVVTCGDERSIASLDGDLVQVSGPRLEAIEPRGAGDSFTAAMAAGIAWGLPKLDAVALGAAAGAVNVTRHGLASGSRDVIERMVELVRIEDYDEAMS